MSITNITNPEILNGNITLNYEVACSLASTFSTELPQRCFQSVWLASSVLQCLPAGLGKLSGEPWGSRGLLSGKGEEVYDTNLMLLFMSVFFFVFTKHLTLTICLFSERPFPLVWMLLSEQASVWFFMEAVLGLPVLSGIKSHLYL